MATEVWWCSNDGEQDNPLADVHGACTICGTELIRIVKDLPKPEPDGIARYFSEN